MDGESGDFAVAGGHVQPPRQLGCVVLPNQDPAGEHRRWVTEWSQRIDQLDELSGGMKMVRLKEPSPQTAGVGGSTPSLAFTSVELSIWPFRLLVPLASNLITSSIYSYSMNLDPASVGCRPRTECSAGRSRVSVPGMCFLPHRTSARRTSLRAFPFSVSP